MNESLSPSNWRRRGQSIEEQLSSRYPPGSRVVVDPVDYAGTISIGSMFQAVIKGQAFLVTKREITEADRKPVASQVKGGGLHYKIDLLTYPTYPLLYQRLFIPLAPVTDGKAAGVSGYMAENVADCTHPDFQDWVLALCQGGSVRAYVCDEHGSTLAEGDVAIDGELGNTLYKALTEAQLILEKTSRALSFNDAGKQFFRDYHAPTWDMVLERTSWWQFWK